MAEEKSNTKAGTAEKTDPLDLGVPMIESDGNEYVGPEDALGAGPKRGDYTDRIGPSSYHPHTTEVIPEDEREEGGPRVRSVSQRPRAEEIGDEKGLKGGVETDPNHPIQKARNR